MKIKIGNDVYEIVEQPSTYLECYRVYKNGELAELCDGSEYETASGAAYAILNEYSIDLD